jgi:hypothetical protein
MAYSGGNQIEQEKKIYYTLDGVLEIGPKGECLCFGTNSHFYPLTIGQMMETSIKKIRNEIMFKS